MVTTHPCEKVVNSEGTPAQIWASIPNGRKPRTVFHAPRKLLRSHLDGHDAFIYLALQKS